MKEEVRTRTINVHYHNGMFLNPCPATSKGRKRETWRACNACSSEYFAPKSPQAGRRTPVIFSAQTPSSHWWWGEWPCQLVTCQKLIILSSFFPPCAVVSSCFIVSAWDGAHACQSPMHTYETNGEFKGDGGKNGEWLALAPVSKPSPGTFCFARSIIGLGGHLPGTIGAEGCGPGPGLLGVCRLFGRMCQWLMILPGGKCSDWSGVRAMSPLLQNRTFPLLACRLCCMLCAWSNGLA